VFHSNRKMWQAMFAAHALGAADAAALDRFLLAALDEAARTLAWCGENLPRERFTVVAQDTLLAEPHHVVRAVVSELRLEGPLHEAALDDAVRRTRGGRVDRYEGELPDASRAAVRALDDTQRVGLQAQAAGRGRS
jgi:hypothetical protein